LPADKWKYIIIIGILGTGLPALLFAKAQTVISSSVAGILNSLTPLFTLATGVLFFGQKARLLRVLGVITGLAGAVGLVYVTSNQSFEFHFTYALFIILATIFYSVQSNIIKTHLNEVNPAAITTLGFLTIGAPAGVYLFFFSDFPEILMNESQGRSGFFYVAILSVFGSVIALILYNRLVQITNAVFATSVTYLVPVVALLWGVLDGERLPVISTAFIALILTGVIMVNKNGALKKNH
jgi:drug/metabolite transporter (DMT)-like permease